MNIDISKNIKPMLFNDLKFGDVFYFTNSYVDNEHIKIYMRCGHTYSDKTAVNLKTGLMYSFDNEPVVLLDVTLEIAKR